MLTFLPYFELYMLNLSAISKGECSPISAKSRVYLSVRDTGVLTLRSRGHKGQPYITPALLADLDLTLTSENCRGGSLLFKAGFYAFC